MAPQRISRFAPLLAAALTGCDGDAPTVVDPLLCDTPECEARLEETAGPAPGGPATVTATLAPSGLRIDVAWPDTSAAEAGFRVYRRERAADSTFTVFHEVAQLPPNSTTFADSADLAPWTGYQYQVRTCNELRCSVRPPHTFFLTTARPPAGLDWIRWAPTRVRISWSWEPDGTTRAEVERRPRVYAGGDYDFVGVATLPAGMRLLLDSVGVSADSAYRYRVRACNGVNCSRWEFTGFASPGVVPAAPSTAYAAVSRAREIAVSWTAGSFPTPLYFLVERRQKNGDGSYAAFQSLAEVATSRLEYADSVGLTAGATYQYRVSGCGAGGCAGRTTGDVTLVVGPPPASPTGLTATAAWEANNLVRLAWSDASSDEASFRLFRRGDTGSGFDAYARIADLRANSRDYADTVSTAPWAAYQYHVRACNAGGCSPASEASGVVTLAQAPADPDGVRYSPLKARVTWRRGYYAEGQDRYEVQRRPASGGEFAEVGRVAGAPEGYLPEVFMDSIGLEALQSYRYRIRACRGSFCSAWSAVVLVEVQAAAPSAVGLRAETVSPTALELAWTPGPTVPTYLRIERRQRNADGSYTPVQMSTEVPAEPRTFVDGGLTGGATYQYQVSACNGRGCTASAPLVQTVESGPPIAPPSLGLNQYALYTLETSWLDVNNNETSYRVGRRSDTGTGFTAFAHVADLPRNSTEYVEQGLPPWVTFQYEVRACNAAGCSPSVVTGLRTTARVRGSATRLSPTAIDVTWTLTPSTGATRVEIRRRSKVGTAVGPLVNLGHVPPSPAVYSDAGLTAGWLYRYEMRGCAGTVCTEWHIGDWM